MKKIGRVFLYLLIPLLFFVSCGEKETTKAIELMGAGDRIHDSFTFANLGVEIKEVSADEYKIFGSVEKLEDDLIKREFEIDEDVNHVVVIKISANGKEVDKEKFSIKIDGVRSYDSDHLNGTDHTFAILEAVKNQSVLIEVSWNGQDKNNYIIKFDENLILK